MLEKLVGIKSYNFGSDYYIGYFTVNAVLFSPAIVEFID